MEQLLLHLVGDYVLQNEWMSKNKIKNSFFGYWAAFIHCIVYSSLFLILGITLEAWLVIFVTHFLIDKYNISVGWIRLVNWSWTKNNLGYGDEKPVWMSRFLKICIDNTFHLVCNYLAIKYLG